MQNSPCSFWFAWSVRVCPLFDQKHWNVPLDTSSLSWGKTDLLGIYLEAKVLRIPAGLSNSYSQSRDLVLQRTGIQVRCHLCWFSCVSTSPSGFFFPDQPWWLILPGLGEGKGRAPKESLIREGVSTAQRILCWNWSFSCHLRIKAPIQVPAFQELRKLWLPCVSPVTGVCLGVGHRGQGPSGSFWAEDQEGLHQTSTLVHQFLENDLVNKN